jgi:competence protein ComFC
MHTPGILRPAYRIYRWAWAGLDLVYPPHCGGCDSPGARWCNNCQENTLQIHPPVCVCCGQSDSSGGLCPGCRAKAPAYTALRSWAFFEGSLRHALHRLKYDGDMALGEVLVRPLIRMYFELGWQVDLVVPVPISLARRTQRGYNQAALLAWPLALSCGLEYQPKALIKVRDARSQVGLSMSERFKNVSGVYQAQDQLVQSKVILVVDDVMTSGATMQACAAAILAAGGRNVYGLTLARVGAPAELQ